MLCLLGLLAIAQSNGIDEDRLHRLETNVQNLADAVKILAASSVNSKPQGEETLMGHTVVEQETQPFFVHRRELATASTKPCARFRNFHGNQVHGNHYLNKVWGAKKFGMQKHQSYLK